MTDPQAERLSAEALDHIRSLSLSVPMAHNDETGFYRSQLMDAIGTAQRAVDALRAATRASAGAGLDMELLAEALRATGALWSANDYYEVTSDAGEFAVAIATEYARLAAARLPVTEEECVYCHGRRWTDDENWQPDDPRTSDGTRREADGLIPCGGCNPGGWDTPLTSLPERPSD